MSAPSKRVAEDPSTAPGAAPPPEAAAAPPPAGRGGRGARSEGGSVVSSSRGGRRQVRARLHLRTASTGSGTSVGAGSPTVALAGDFPRAGTGSCLGPIATGDPAGAGDGASSPRSSHSAGSEAAPTEQAQQRPHEQQRERPERGERDGRAASRRREVASLLADPERHRRAVAAGSSNPLHVWGHETAFIKSRYFSSKRRREEKQFTSQKEQAEWYLDEGTTPQTVAGGGGGGWSASSSVPSPRSPGGGTHKRLLSDSTRNGAGKGSGECRRGDASSSSSSSSSSDGAFPEARSSLMVKNDQWSAQEHCRTRNMNALHAFSWDQRVFLPQRKGTFSAVFDLLASPRFWEKLDWTIRGSVFTILPTLILCLEPTTRHIFPLPTSVVFLAYWTTQPTLGAGLRETFIVMKGFSISLVCLLIIIAIHPGPEWLVLLILFCLLLVTGFVAEQLKRMVAYCFASLLMAYIRSPATTTYTYVGKYYLTILIGQGFGLASFVFPYIRWSSENARRYIVITGDAVSLSVHGACCSFWVENSLLERQLHVARLRQLRSTIGASMEKAQQGLSEMGYEPHSGVYTARLKTRMAFLKSVFNVVQSMTLVIEQVAANPALVETPLCREFGERIRGELNLIGAAMDSLILRVVDLDNLVSVADMTAFRLARSRYEEAVSTVRDEVILSNPDYRTDHSDILLGFFLFSVEELMEIIGNFQDTPAPPSNLYYFLTFPLRDLQSSWAAFVDLYHAIRIRRSITRRLKEAIKLTLCIIVAAIFQVYAMKNASTSPTAGVDIIAFVYRATGGESFQYATKRMLGTVLGSLTGLLSVQIAAGHRPTLYGCTLVLTFIGAYVQASPEYGPLGSALANSVVSIVLNYLNATNAMTRIQQNCFAILIYFIVSSLVWPVRGRTKVATGLDVSLRMAREATDRLLCNLDLPDSATAVSADVLAVLGEMQKKVGQQQANIPGAIAEPTLDSAGFPEMPWRMLVAAQRRLLVTLYMMRHAYHTFMTSTIAEEAGRRAGDNVDMVGAGPAAATSISVHWVVLHRISPHTRQLSRLFYEAMEVYLLTLSKATFVPTAELTRLRLGMMQCYDRIVAVYMETIQHELNNSDDDDDEGGEGGGEGAGGSAAAAAVVGGAAGFVPPPASTFAPHATTVGGTADAAEGVRNGSMWGPRNKSFAGGGASFRRASGGSGGSGDAAGRAGGGGGGRFSYRLTAEERQRLREYVLGPSGAGAANASFFAHAAAMAAAAEQGAATVPPLSAGGAAGSGGGGTAAVVANRTFAGHGVANHSLFNAAGSFWNASASMLDPALLRSAGIVVQAPVHEEPQRRREGSEGGARSSQPSGLRGSFVPRSGSGNRTTARRDSAVADVHVEEPLEPMMRLVSDQMSLPSEGGGSAVPPLPQRNRSPVKPASLPSASTPQQPGSVGSHDLPAGSFGGAAGTVKRSKTSKYAMPSVLQMSMVLPAGAYALRDAAANTATTATPAAAAGGGGVVGSGSRLPGPSPSVVPGQLTNYSMTSASGLKGNGSFVSGVVGGDVFSLGRGARAAVRPTNPWSVAGLTAGGRRPEHDGHGAAAAVTDGQMLGAGEHEAVPDGLEEEQHRLSDHSGLPSHMVSDGPTAAPSLASPAAVGGALRRHGGTQSAGSHEPIDAEVRVGSDEGGPEALDAVGSGLLCDPLQHSELQGGSATTPHVGASASPAALLTSPLPVPLHDDAVEQHEQPAAHNSTFTRPFLSTSFSAGAPAIPEALRAYVEGLAEQQRQQVPPPPAVLGNTSFLNIGSNVPLGNRSFLGSGGGANSVYNSTFFGNAAMPQNTSTLVTAGGPGAGVSTSNASFLKPLPTGDVASAVQADFVSAVSRLEFHNGTFCATGRGAERAEGGEVLLQLLGGDGEGGDGGGAEYVLTNSDIHSLEAFLFGLRALITQVEELERHLLEMVHGNEMATKL